MNENTSSGERSQHENNNEHGQTESSNGKNHESSGNSLAPTEEVTENNCRFDPGQPLRFARVRFPGHARSYPFLVGKRKLVYGQKVMAMSDRGMAVGYVNSFVYELPFDKSMLPLKSINKIATEDDIEREQDTYQKQKSTETLCQRLIDKHNLDMNLTHVEFTQFGKKVVFYFTAPARVDFRSLVKDLVAELKLRIELRQISVRDRSASMGALGPCGRELCCSSFLSRYGNVSIKMTKNQNLTLNYSKLNGVCGQLKCCLQYEDEVYHQKRKKLPKEGSFAEALNGDKGKIFRLHILSEQFDLLTEKGKIKRYAQGQFKKRLKPDEVNMPDRFENISDETSTVIGLNELDSKKSAQFEKDMVKLKERAGKYASEVFEDLTGLSKEEQQETPQQKEAQKEKEMLAEERNSEKSFREGRGEQDLSQGSWTPEPLDAKDIGEAGATSGEQSDKSNDSSKDEGSKQVHADKRGDGKRKGKGRRGNRSSRGGNRDGKEAKGSGQGQRRGNRKRGPRKNKPSN